MDKAQKIFDRLWADYTSRNPEVKKIYDLFISQGERVLNDHIAFRTFNDPRVNIEVFSKPFVDAGYEYRGEYTFEEKHLYARHYEHKTFADAPRVFISELITQDFSASLQATVKKIIGQISENLLLPNELIFSGAPWKFLHLKFTINCEMNRNMPAGFTFMVTGPIILPSM